MINLLLIVLVHNLIVKRKCINGQCILSGKILQCTGEKGLGKKEPADPKDNWWPLQIPSVKERYAVQEICKVGTQRLHTGIRFGQPESRDFANQYATAHIFK